MERSTAFLPETTPTRRVPATCPADASAAPADGLPYHRLAAVTPAAKQWWRPIAMIGVFVVVGAVTVGLVRLAVWLLGGVPALPKPSKGWDDPRNPMDVVMTFGLIALLLPVTIATVRLAGARRGTIHSVLGRFRWNLLRGGLVRVLPVYALVNIGGFLLLRPSDFSVPAMSGSLVVVTLLTLVLVPLQSAAEEYVFRGLIPQMIGTWLRSAWWGVIVSVPLFAVLHGYDRWGLVQVGCFALCTAYLTWKSGGLEFAIAMHAANNLTLSLMAPLSPGSMQQGSVDPGSLVLSVPVMVGVTVLLGRYASHEFALRRSEPLVRPRGMSTV